MTKKCACNHKPRRLSLILSHIIRCWKLHSLIFLTLSSPSLMVILAADIRSEALLKFPVWISKGSTFTKPMKPCNVHKHCNLKAYEIQPIALFMGRICRNVYKCCAIWSHKIFIKVHRIVSVHVIPFSVTINTIHLLCLLMSVGFYLISDFGKSVLAAYNTYYSLGNYFWWYIYKRV